MNEAPLADQLAAMTRNRDALEQMLRYILAHGAVMDPPPSWVPPAIHAILAQHGATARRW